MGRIVKTGGELNAVSGSKSYNIPYYLILVFFVLVVSIGVAGYIYNDHQKADIIKEKQNELSAIADLKTSQITYWLGERLKDANLISDNFLIAGHVAKLAENPANRLLQKEVFAIIQSPKKQYDYMNIIVLDAKGRLLISTERERRQIAADTLKTALQAVKDKKVIWTDIHRGRLTVKPHIDIYVPLIGQKNGLSYVTGIFVMQVDPSQYFFPLIQNWPTPSPSAETMLIRREGDEVVYINELRHKKDTALSLRVSITQKQVVAVMAVLGKEGVAEGIDYTGIPVMAAIKKIPDTPWFIVAKVDKEETFERVHRRAWFIAIIGIVLIIAAGLSIGLWWRQQRVMYYRRQLETEMQFNEERKRAEELLKESGKKYRNLVENALVGIYRTNMKGDMLYANEALARLFEFESSEEVMSHGAWARYKNPEDRKAMLERLRKTGKIDNFEVEMITNMGKTKHIVFTATLEGDDLSGMVIDITERKRAEETLRETKEYLENLFNYANAPIIVWDPQFRITRFNHAFESLTGRSADEVIGKSLEILFPPTLVASSMELIKRTQRGERWETVEINILHLDGSVRIVLWNSATIFTPDGKNPMATIAQGHDITERKKAEEALKRYTAELKRSNEELQQFAYIASHDLQEPLRMIASYLQLIERRYKGKLDKDADEFIGFASDGAIRLQEMIIGLLAYSRVGTKVKPFEDVNCSAVLGNAISNLKLAIQESGALVTSDRLPVVRADENQLVQVFQNLISNAIKFKGSELPRIHISAEKKDMEWLFSVKDNGIGISPEYKDRIFNIFQRLHGREYPGVGIGLSLCRRIIERHGGKIWFESEVEKGTTFYFTIPIKEEEKA